MGEGNRLNRIVTGKPAYLPLTDLSYTYDDAGNITSIVDGTRAETMSYEYDFLNRLIYADVFAALGGSGSQQMVEQRFYTYDTIGNLMSYRKTYLSASTATGAFHVGGTGSSTNYQNRNNFNGLSTIGSSSANYGGSGVTQYVAGDFGPPPSGVTTNYLYGLGLIGQQAGSTTRFMEYDGLGSVRQLTDSAAAIQRTQTYDPYGNQFSSTGTQGSGYQYTGEQTDANGLVYLRARYYNPAYGRFMQMDPSRMEVNLYEYAGSNPVNRVDPSGNCTSPFTGTSAYLRDFWWLPGFKAMGAMWEECQQNIAAAFQPLPDDGRSMDELRRMAEDRVCQATICPTLRDIAINTQQDFTASNRIFTGGWSYLASDPMNFGLDVLSTADVTQDILTLGVGALGPEDALLASLRRSVRDSVDAQDALIAMERLGARGMGDETIAAVVADLPVRRVGAQSLGVFSPSWEYARPLPMAQHNAPNIVNQWGINRQSTALAQPTLTSLADQRVALWGAEGDYETALIAARQYQPILPGLFQYGDATMRDIEIPDVVRYQRHHLWPQRLGGPLKGWAIYVQTWPVNFHTARQQGIQTWIDWSLRERTGLGQTAMRNWATANPQELLPYLRQIYFDLGIDFPY